MLTVGLTSVTFEKLSCEEIVEYCKKSGIDTIEWGSSTHVLINEPERAKEIKALCDREGMKISSYGSYYRCGEYEDAESEFAKYIEAAKIIGAPKIRVWVGKKDFEAADEAYFNKIIAELKMMCQMAKKEGISLGCEFHEATLTNKGPNSLKVIEAVGEDNLGMYFQHDFFESIETNCNDLISFIPTLKNIHVYNVTTEYKRYSLGTGIAPEFWGKVAKILNERNVDANLILEFLPNPSLEELIQETKILKEIAGIK